MTNKQTIIQILHLPTISRRTGFLLLFCFCISFCFSQSTFLDSLLKRDLPQYSGVLNNPSKYKLRIFYTQINRDRNNEPDFVTHDFQSDTDYIYPASTVKLPMSVLALMKVQELNIKGLEKNTAMMTDSAFTCRKKVTSDSSSGLGYPTLENYIKKMLLVSDNQAFARTYDFVDYDYAHEKLKGLGFEKVRIFNRLESQCTTDTVLGTAPVYFLNPTGDTLYKQPRRLFSGKREHSVKNSAAGIFNRNANGKWVRGAKDFSKHNYLDPEDLHRFMQKLVFNNYSSKREKLPLSDENRLFLLKQLGSYPRESEYPRYTPKVYYDSYKKYLMYGARVANISQDSIRVINIVGRAYGFLIDCAYIIDLKNNIEFLLTATIYVNENGKIGSGKYEYDQLGLPFMKDLGWSIYNYERSRKKKHLPDLRDFDLLFRKN